MKKSRELSELTQLIRKTSRNPIIKNIKSVAVNDENESKRANDSALVPANTRNKYKRL
jgi:hypothetical protein